jgi:hypothetical protein
MQHRVLEALPVYGESAITFSATGYGKHTEGLVVELSATDGASWVGNFIPGIGGLDLVVPHPDGINALIISGGQAYVVDPDTRRLLDTFGGALGAFWHDHSRHALIFESSGIAFLSVGPKGIMWRSRRVSWDGFRSLVVDSESLSGEAWCFDDSWHSFKLELASGSVSGGAYAGVGGAST